MREQLCLISLVLLVSIENAGSYSQQTHREITKAAVRLSDIVARSDLVRDLGLRSSFVERERSFLNSKLEERPILGLIEDGADFEDDGIRAITHFFDPMNYRGLSVPGVLNGLRSPDWVLSEKDTVLIQKFALSNARDHIYLGLTKAKKTERDKNFGLLFETLGHVVHHIQDMAQPQHVRNDAHFPVSIIGDPSLYEDYSNIKYVDRKTDLPNTYQPVSLALPVHYWHTNQTGLDNLKRGIGIAEYTNRGFVSKDTNFRGSPQEAISHPDYPLPEFDPRKKVVLDVTQLKPGTNLKGKIHFFGNDVVDNYTGDKIHNPMMTTWSLFDEDLTRYGFRQYWSFSLNTVNYDAYHGFLIPRAIGYSAGLINYFFRGRLELTLPKAGIYGMVDHATPHALDVNGLPRDSSGNVFGFSKLKVKIRNLTESIQEPGDPPPEPLPQDMRSGELRAIVKYQLNYCYEPDLSGEMKRDQNGLPFDQAQTWSGCSGARYLTGVEDVGAAIKALKEDIHERIAVSAAERVGSAVGEIQISRDNAVEVTFDFSQDPIPINARDVYLQVVYRGELGPKFDPTKVEPDAVVVATKDISEPTYLTVINSTDRFALDDGFYTRDQIVTDAGRQQQLDLLTENEAGFTRATQDQYLNPRPLTDLRFGIGEFNVAEVDSLPPGRFSRIVVMRDQGEMNWGAKYLLAPYDQFSSNPFRTFQAPLATISQYDRTNERYDFALVEERRGVYTTAESVNSTFAAVFDQRPVGFTWPTIGDDFNAQPKLGNLLPYPISCDRFNEPGSCPP